MGVGVMQTKNEVLLEQSAYTKALLCRFGMDKANSVATPVDVNADLVTTSDEVEDCDKDLYQSAVALPVDVAASVRDCLSNPDPNTPYSCLKNRLLSKLQVPPIVRAKTLFEGSGILSVSDNVSPSEILRELRKVAQGPRRLPPDRLAAAKAEFQTMLDAGTIRVSNSPWASPLLLVPKADGNFRPCGDYQQLNAVTQPDRFPIPHLHDFSANLNGATIFSKIDLTHAFHQIPMDESSIAKTAVTTPFGLFEFTTMPYGLRNAPQTFQRHTYVKYFVRSPLCLRVP
ncbi:Reverse transcriptase domain [Trinorchestia longiramus]|nr:Reverse transcriptase domain [Trinorchestia longiramus]